MARRDWVSAVHVVSRLTPRAVIKSASDLTLEAVCKESMGVMIRVSDFLEVLKQNVMLGIPFSSKMGKSSNVGTISSSFSLESRNTIRVDSYTYGKGIKNS